MLEQHTSSPQPEGPSQILILGQGLQKENLLIEGEAKVITDTLTVNCPGHKSLHPPNPPHNSG